MKKITIVVFRATGECHFRFGSQESDLPGMEILFSISRVVKDHHGVDRLQELARKEAQKRGLVVMGL